MSFSQFIAFKLRHILALPALALIVPTQVLAISASDLQRHISINISQSLPITVLGPLISSEIQVRETAAGFNILIPDAAFTGGSPLGDISFSMTPIDDDQFQVSNAVLPRQFLSKNQDLLPIKEHSLSGVWSIKNSAYGSLDYKIAGFSSIEDTADFTFTNFDFQLGEQNEAGEQALKIDVGPIAFNNRSKQTSLVFDGLKAAGKIKSPERLTLYKTIAQIVGTLSETGSEIIADQKGLMQLIAPLYVPYESSSIDIATGKLVFDQPELKTKLSINALSFASSANNLLENQRGESQFEFKVEDLDLMDRDNRLEFDEFKWIGATDQIDGNHAFTFGRDLLSKVLDEEAEIDLADAFDLYFNFNNFGMEVSIENLIASSGGGEGIELENARFGGTIKGARTNSADISFLLSHGDVQIPGFDNTLLLSLKPDVTRLKLGLDGIAVSKIRDAMKGQLIPVSLISGDEKALSEFLRNIGFQLLSVILEQPPKIVIEDSKIDTPTIKAGLDGAFDISPVAKYIASGTLNITANGLKELQQAASIAMATSTGRTRKIALGMVGGLGLAQGFGRRQDNGSLLYALSLDEVGKIAVNGLPIPKLPF